MFKKIPNGKCVKIDNGEGVTVDIWIPPLGYGFNTITGDIEKTDVFKKSNNPSEQVWFRIDLPKDWKERRRAEKEKQKANPDYYDLELEKIRQKHWHYRFCGIWIYLNGIPTYITGEHWMYINWWQLDEGYPDYRDCDRKRYYFQEYCIHDPRCAGLLEGSNRRSGKSYRSSLFNYNYVSITPESKGGLQSKTDADAKNFFRTKLVTPFKRLPDFFQPEIDLSAGSSMGKEIKFTKTARKGKAALEGLDDLGLNSYIDFRSSEEYAYDGEKLHRYVADEVGKPSDADVYERHNVVRYCLRVGKNWIGKALYTTTPESIEGVSIENYPFYKLWQDSDMNDRDKNGHTKSGLYRYFIPADETLDFDKYGMPKIEENRKYIFNTREALKNNQKKLLSEIKKNPLTVEEMFKITLTNNCLFNIEKLSDRLDFLSYNKNHFVRGNFLWDGEQDSSVSFVVDNNGRWMLLKPYADKKIENTVTRRGSNLYPANVYSFTIGCDPYDHDQVTFGSGSKGAISVYQKFNAASKLPQLNNSCVCLYLFRPQTAPIFYEDVLKTAFYFGADILFENQKIGLKRYALERGYEGFLIKLAGNTEYGISSSPSVKQNMADLIEYEVETKPENLFFKPLVEQLLQFDIKKTEIYDAVMAYGYSLIADKHRLIKKNKTELYDISEWFRRG